VPASYSGLEFGEPCFEAEPSETSSVVHLIVCPHLPQLCLLLVLAGYMLEYGVEQLHLSPPSHLFLFQIELLGFLSSNLQPP